MPKPKNTNGCGEIGCDQAHYSKGLCRYHYDLTREGRGGSLVQREQTICSRDKCNRLEHAKGLCQAHYRQAQRRARGLKKPGFQPKPGAVSHQKLPPEVIHQRKEERKKKTLGEVCVNGHRMTPENTRIRRDDRYTGGVQRICKICFRNADRKSRGLPPLDDPNAPVGVANKDKTHCPSGHEYTPENTYLMKGKYRRCRKCLRYQHAKFKYGIIPEQFEALIELQKNRCAICLAEFTDEDPICVDHDHETDEVRGLLCGSHNNGLGRFSDRPDWLRRAADYLEHPPASRL